MKFRNKNNRCQCIGNIVKVDFKQRIIIWKWKIKIMTYINHKYEVMKMKNKWKILWSTQYDSRIYE